MVATCNPSRQLSTSAQPPQIYGLLSLLMCHSEQYAAFLADPVSPGNIKVHRGQASYFSLLSHWDVRNAQLDI